MKHMDYANMQFCQSCGMPMDKEEVKGTDAGGGKNEDYCVYCWKDGVFTHPGATMEEMIELCIPHMPMPAGEARKQMESFFPTLKRWKQA